MMAGRPSLCAITSAMPMTVTLVMGYIADEAMPSVNGHWAIAAAMP